MAQRITETVDWWFKDAWDEAPSADNVHWAITVVWHDEYGVSLYCSALTPGPLLGTTLSTGRYIPAPNTLTQDAVKKIVWGLNDQLQAQASEAIRTGQLDGSMEVKPG